MPCYHPLPAWRLSSGDVVLREPVSQIYDRFLQLPCGHCIGCETRRRFEWVLRSRFELQQHAATCWATLTYDELCVPPTLVKSALSGFLKRLRARRSDRLVRFFGCGEYGEKFGRPHYHVVLFGVPRGDSEDVRACWKYGNVRVDPISPAALSYVVGYSAKKLGAPRIRYPPDVVDPATGEVLPFQEPFVLMSRRPGIGGHVRQWPESWKESAVLDGRKVPVPRYLHAAWRAQATPAEVDALSDKRYLEGLSRSRTKEQLRAAERIAFGSRDNRAMTRSL